MLTKFNKIYNRLFVEPVQYPQMGFIRIIVGLILLFNLLSLLPMAPELFGPAGLRGSALEPDHIYQRPSHQNFTCSSCFQTEVHMWLTLSLYVVVSLFFSAGLALPFSGALLFLLHSILLARQEMVFWGWGELIKVVIVWLSISKSSLSYSIKLKALRWNEWFLTSSYLPVFLLQFHFILLYFMVAYSRLNNEMWWDGSALERILLDETFSRWPHLYTPGSPLWAALGSVAWILELLVPIAILFRFSRKYAIAFIIALHVGLEILTMVGWWNFLMLALSTLFIGVFRSQGIDNRESKVKIYKYVF